MKKSQKIVLISFIPAVLTLVFILYVLMPTLGEKGIYNHKLESKREEILIAKQKLEKAKATQELHQKIIELQKELGGFDLRVPEQQELAMFLIDLEKFADRSNVQVVGLDVRPEKVLAIKDPKKEAEKAKNKKRRRKKQQEEELPVKVWEVPIEIKLIGFYPDIIKFMNKAEKYQRLISTSGIIVKDHEKDSQKRFPRVKMTITANIYRMVEQEIKQEETEAKSPQK